jgi:hypothetical protein
LRNRSADCSGSRLSPSASPRGVELVEGDGDLEHNQEQEQEHDHELEPQCALGIDDVGQRSRRIGDDRELAAQDLGVLLQLVFVLEPRIEPFEVGTIRAGEFSA